MSVSSIADFLNAALRALSGKNNAVLDTGDGWNAPHCAGATRVNGVDPVANVGLVEPMVGAKPDEGALIAEGR